jgi:putative flippase GtrA
MIALLVRLFKGETSNTLIQLFRYALVGGCAFVVDFALLALLVRLAALHYLLAAALAFLGGVVTNYSISVLWVFDQRSLKSPAVEFAVFAILGVFGLGLTEIVLFILTGLLGMDVLVSKVVATAATFVWNFASRKVILFSLSPADQTPLQGDERQGLPLPLGVGSVE